MKARLKTLPATSSNLQRSMVYALNAGGKRLRPALVYSAAQSLRPQLDFDQPQLSPIDLTAVAIEAIHTYSLVHDDLPAMDDDSIRRGQPTVHIVFDEATAILAGDALLTWAFENLTEIDSLPPATVVEMVRVLSKAAGPSGMVEGQAMDMQSTGVMRELAELQQLHQHKTGALIKAALVLGALCVAPSPAQKRALSRYGEAVGLCFQIVDDILDVTTDSQALGKTAGKDQQADKLTYVKLLGLEGARQEANRLCDQACESILDLPHPDTLVSLARHMVNRTH